MPATPSSCRRAHPTTHSTSAPTRARCSPPTSSKSTNRWRRSPTDRPPVGAGRPELACLTSLSLRRPIEGASWLARRSLGTRSSRAQARDLLRPRARICGRAPAPRKALVSMHHTSVAAPAGTGTGAFAPVVWDVTRRNTSETTGALAPIGSAREGRREARHAARCAAVRRASWESAPGRCSSIAGVWSVETETLGFPRKAGVSSALARTTAIRRGCRINHPRIRCVDL
jgi:hypothetical protein